LRESDGHPLDQRFPAESRIKKRRDFLAARRRGRRSHTKHFLVDVHRSPARRRRLGVTVSRKVGNAVQRNRVKRWLREVYRQHQEIFPNQRDIVITAKRGFQDFSYTTIRDELIALFSQYAKASDRSQDTHRSRRRESGH